MLSVFLFGDSLPGPVLRFGILIAFFPEGTKESSVRCTCSSPHASSTERRSSDSHGSFLIGTYRPSVQLSVATVATSGDSALPDAPFQCSFFTTHDCIFAEL